MQTFIEIIEDCEGHTRIELTEGNGCQFEAKFIYPTGKIEKVIINSDFTINGMKGQKVDIFQLHAVVRILQSIGWLEKSQLFKGEPLP